ncbi:Adenylate cyclase, partial [Tetrabaena socialis]
QGYKESWVTHVEGVPSMGPRLQCVRIVTPWYVERPWAVVLIVLGGLLIAAWVTYLSCYRRGKRAAILQNYYNLRKRVKGEPLGGQVSIVVTDIEGYSDLMKQSPELMTRALTLHNTIIRKARWANFGYTVEQEGDSYSLVFYEALDAVIFCLQ